MDQLIGRYARRAAAALEHVADGARVGVERRDRSDDVSGDGAIGFSTGLYALHPANSVGLPLRLIETFIAPAIGEELVFRGMLIPARAESPRFVGPLVVSTAVFTLWHVVEAKTFLTPAATMFLRGDFLVCAATLGVGCAMVRRLTGSLWPAVALHWMMVGIWQTWLGGFTV